MLCASPVATSAWAIAKGCSALIGGTALATAHIAIESMRMHARKKEIFIKLLGGWMTAAEGEPGWPLCSEDFKSQKGTFILSPPAHTRFQGLDATRVARALAAAMAAG